MILYNVHIYIKIEHMWWINYVYFCFSKTIIHLCFLCLFGYDCIVLCPLCWRLGLWC